jgi:hypothetical protein
MKIVEVKDIAGLEFAVEQSEGDWIKLVSKWLRRAENKACRNDQ